MPRLARGARWVLRAAALFVLVTAVVPLLGIAVTCGNWRAAAAAPPSAYTPALADIPGYVHPRDQTYLTFPEWAIVYAADDFAAFTADRSPSDYPYFAAVLQYWDGYYRLCEQTRNGPFNWGYHLSLAVTGISFTWENVIKGGYENTVGRLTGAIGGHATPEDRWAWRAATRYGDFIHVTPWYAYPFDIERAELAALAPPPDTLRRIERRVVLEAEYRFKQAYARLIGGGSQATFGTVTGEVFAVVTGLDQAALSAEPGVRWVRALPAGEAVIALERYDPFTRNVQRLAGRGLRFVEVAGNDVILISALAPAGSTYGGPGVFHFAQPVLITPDRSRWLLTVLFAELSTALDALRRAGATIEHLYDY